MQTRKQWIALGITVAISFLILGFAGYKGIQSKPPIPQRVVTTDGTVVIGPGAIMDGQNVWQSIGGQEIASIFGHGAYLAPDWTADYLHRELTLIPGSRANTYDPATGTITISAGRAAAFETLVAHYSDVFANGRKEYAIPRGALTDPAKLRQMTAFFF